MDWNSEIAKKAANTIRILSAEAVQRANSGHPGMPMGAADYALVLWARHVMFNPKDPAWPARDRFVLSAGHGSMLLYSLLHLFGYDLNLDDIKKFRQLGSRTPGHPEYGHTPGVETTTGPLGQGFANGVGMALAEKLMAARVNTEKFPVLDHKIYGIVSDGDLMEGVSAEAASLAGHLGLGNIVYVYDDNAITIEGDRDLSFSEEVKGRFEAVGWHVLSCDGHDRDAMDKAISEAERETERPSLVMARTQIGFGCPTKAGSADTHGAPLGGEELSACRDFFDWKSEEISVPDDVYNFCRYFLDDKIKAYDEWNRMENKFKEEEQEKAKLYEDFLNGKIPADIEDKLLSAMEDKPLATRKSSGAALQVAAKEVPWMFGGSADLAPSNNTMVKGEDSVEKGNFAGRNIHFGIREHAMGAMLNGMALYGLVPYGGTFLVFSDYMRPSIRLAALMGIKVIYVFTHDSIFVGEDGPTHQPVEHVSALRIIPNLHVVRPADSPETALAWSEAIKREGPTALILSRQTLPVIDREKYGKADGLKKGAYILADSDGMPDLIIMSTGSEVGLSLEVAEEYKGRGKKVRVVSMPCLEKFEEQGADYRESILPKAVKKRVVMEAGVSSCWHRYAGDEGLVFSVDRFGASAPFKDLAKEFGFNKDALVEMVDCTYPDLKA